MTRETILDHLSRVNRAYNALYGMGMATPETVQTLSPDEATHILQVACEAARGEGDTEMHRRMRTMSPALLRYVAGAK